jgi:hypothetical protein
MDEMPKTQYILPRELVSAAVESQVALRKVVEQIDRGHLVVRNVPLIAGEITATDLYWFLSLVARHRAFDSIEGRAQSAAGVALHSPAGKVIAAFIRRFFKRIRDAICGPKKRAALGVSAMGAAASLARFIAEHFGLQEEMAKAVATSVLVAILMATKGAFCDVTEEKALKAILEAARIE